MDKCREAFEKWYEFEHGEKVYWSAMPLHQVYLFSAWQEQQKRIDELEQIIKLRDQQLTEEIGLSTKYVGKFSELQARVDAFKAQSEKLRECSESCVYNEREKNILLSQADDIDQILGVEQAFKGGEV